MRWLADFIMHGRMQAIAVAATSLMLSLLVPPLSLFAAAVVALVTLYRGGREGLNTLLGSALAAGLLGAMAIGNFVLPAGYGLMLWLPTWGMALVLRHTGNLSWTFELLTVLGLIGIVAMYLISPDAAGFWRERMQQAFEALKGPVGVSEDLGPLPLEVLARYMTGVVAAGMVSSLALSLLFARWWQALVANPGGFKTEFLRLRLHRPMAYLTLALGAAGIVVEGQTREAVVNLLLVLAVVYVGVGTAVLHAIFSGRGQKFWLWGLYGLMVLVPHVLLPVALVGLSDTWLDWRGRFVPLQTQRLKG
jgi:hypothetical protein